MRILVVGSGGREHALVWKLAQSPSKPELFAAPGNPGTSAHGRNLEIEATDVDALVRFARAKEIDLTVVGPEQPLVSGIVDRFREEGLTILGPTAAAARLEGSKAFAKAFMERHEIPTAAHRTFSAEEAEAAKQYVRDTGAPIVVKASGLAGGKGAFVCETEEEGLGAIDRIVSEARFEEAGEEIVVEEFMQGEEASVFVLTDGERYVLLPPAQDHKQIGEGDTGPNTGGMGAYAPAPVVTGSLLQKVCREIVEPTLSGMREEETPYTGFLYCGLMITEEGPRVVEYNCRLGDPEAQAVLPLLDVDLATVFEQVASGEMERVRMRTYPGFAACVVLASQGYPGDYESGHPITGIDPEDADQLLFHAGTATGKGGELLSSGGRVLAAVGRGDTLDDALDVAYESVDQVSFKNKYFRRDIGKKGLGQLR